MKQNFTTTSTNVCSSSTRRTGAWPKLSNTNLYKRFMKSKNYNHQLNSTSTSIKPISRPSTHSNCTLPHHLESLKGSSLESNKIAKTLSLVTPKTINFPNTSTNYSQPFLTMPSPSICLNCSKTYYSREKAITRMKRGPSIQLEMIQIGVPLICKHEP